MSVGAGGTEGPWHFRITIKGGGVDYAHHITTAPPPQILRIFYGPEMFDVCRRMNLHSLLKWPRVHHHHSKMEASIQLLV